MHSAGPRDPSTEMGRKSKHHILEVDVVVIMLRNVQFKLGGFSFPSRCTNFNWTITYSWWLWVASVCQDLNILRSKYWFVNALWTALAIPAAYETAMQCKRSCSPIPLTRLTWTQASEGPNQYSVISKGASIILLLVYCSYLYFQVCSVSLQSEKFIRVTTPRSPGLSFLKRLVVTSWRTAYHRQLYLWELRCSDPCYNYWRRTVSIWRSTGSCPAYEWAVCRFRVCHPFTHIHPHTLVDYLCWNITDFCSSSPSLGSV